MRTIDVMPLVVGVPGVTLEAAEREVLERVQPAGIILFARNIESARQTRALVEAAARARDRALSSQSTSRAAWSTGSAPCGAICRHRRRPGRPGRRAVRALGEAAGAACRRLGVHLDLAPVVDLECSGRLPRRPGAVLQRRSGTGRGPGRMFNEGLATWGVTGCSKHFPGLGWVPADTHEELPLLDPGDAGARPPASASSKPWARISRRS